MLEGVKGGDRLGAPARLNRFITTNLQMQQLETLHSKTLVLLSHSFW